MNTPVSTDNDDVIGISSAVEAIKQASDNDAQIVGVIADYGSGKSSLTETLAMDKERFDDAIIINMWDSLSKSAQPDGNTNIAIHSLTKSFLYQLASGVSENAAKHVNRRLSKNYGIISFSISSWSFWGWIIAGLICYIVFAAISSIPLSQIKALFMAFNPNITPKALLVWTSIIKYCAPLFLVMGVVIAIIGLRNINIAFSHWKVQNPRETEINDVFESYAYIHSKLLAKNRRRLVIVEDLDRIDSRTLVVGFLKEVYRFCNLPRKSSGKKEPIFVISVKPESHLKSLDKSPNIAAYDTVFPKILDYTVTLKPIHYEDYENIVLQIIGDKESKARIALQNVLDEKDKITGDALPSSFSWIATGHNLTIRQLKDRLNCAVALLISLKNKRYSHNPSVDFAACAAVTYLEAQYPKQYSELIKQETAFSNMVQESYAIRNSRFETKEDKSKMMRSVVDDLVSKLTSEVQADSDMVDCMKTDIVKMLFNGDISDDFRMYFYSYPKNSYIKNGDEKDISNLLLLPNDYVDDDKLNEKMRRVIDSGKESTILSILNRISADAQKSSFPPIITKNEFLFESAYTINSKKTNRTVYALTSWKENDCESNQEILARLYVYSFDQKKQFWSEYASWLQKYIDEFSDERKINIRKSVISVFQKDIVIFRALFVGETATADLMPLITNDELISLPDVGIGIALINNDIIDSNTIDYIAAYTNQSKLSIENYKTAHLLFFDATKKIPANILWRALINFLSINEKVDFPFFSFAAGGITEDPADKKMLGKYISALEIDSITDEYCDVIDKAFIDENLSEAVLWLLYKNKKFIALLSSLAKNAQLDMVDFVEDGNTENVLFACESILGYDQSLIPQIRKTIIKQFKAEGLLDQLPNIFSDIFYDEYPIISMDECTELDSASVMVRLLNRYLVDDSNYLDIANFINEHTASDNCFEVLGYLFSNEYSDKYQDNDCAQKLINNIKFFEIGFCDLSRANQEQILDYIALYINLSNSSIANNFMLISHCLIPRLEKVLVNQGDINMYVATINEIDVPSEYTAEWLSTANVGQAFSPNSLKVLLQQGNEHMYLVGKVLAQGTFEFPYHDVSNETVLSCYTLSSPIWKCIKDNAELKNYIVQTKAYEYFDDNEFPDVIKPLYFAKQDADFVRFVLAKVNDMEKIEYFQTMGEILDASNSIVIANILSEEPYVSLLEDKKLFYKVRERLWEEAPRGYKHVFTRKRNDRFPNDKA